MKSGKNYHIFKKKKKKKKKKIKLNFKRNKKNYHILSGCVYR